MEDSAVQSLLQQQPTVEILDENSETVATRRRWYASVGILIAPPVFLSDGLSDAGALAPLPSPTVTIGVRRANGAIWQTSFLLVPLYEPNGSILDTPYVVSTTGFDIDRVSTNRSSIPDLDVRWKVGLRVVGIGIYGIPIPIALGAHGGIRFERKITGTLSLLGWGDMGVLPSISNGEPLIDLRSEVGLAWYPRERPRMRISVTAFNEFVIVPGETDGFMTPGIMTRVGWHY